MSRVRCADLAPLPLSLYIHFPWCARKCPYCDFNSHGIKSPPPLEAYISQLLADFREELGRPSAHRPLQSIFIGGGTPSLAPGEGIRRLLGAISELAELAPGIEVTLEANPGTADAASFCGYRSAGVNRLSIGVQSLSAHHLARLGRIHDPEEARDAYRMARSAGLSNINLDMMFGLPGQGLQEAAEDLDRLMDLEPEHISYYQLTLEPNTPFYAHPPEVPDADLLADMGEQGVERLAAAGYERYEVSAFARPGFRCRHNLNYWQFGDYLGIGAGAHGKLTEPGDDDRGFRICRTAKRKSPDAYLRHAPAALTDQRRLLGESDAIFELALNAFRLMDGFEPSLLTDRTGLPWSSMAPLIDAAVGDGLLTWADDRVRTSDLGRNFLNDLVARFMGTG